MASISPLIEKDTNVETVHQLLRNLRQSAYLENSVWGTSTLVLRKLHDQPQLSRSQAIEAVLTDVLARFAQEAPVLADLLRGRFWEELAVEEMRNSGRPETQSTGRFYQQQRRAIERFAILLQEEEVQCAQSQTNLRLLQRLPIASYRRLFGFEGYIEQLHRYLVERQRYPIVSIKGIGGIGKTALADSAVRSLINIDTTLHDVVWISAKQEYISERSLLQGTGQTGLRLEQVFDELGYKLGISEVLRLPLDQKIEKLAGLLRSAPYLVILDNLESLEDYQQVMPWLLRLASPTQFLLTARNTIPALNTITQLEVNELNYDASSSLMNFIIREKGGCDFDPEAIFSLVGGNPLALILTVSQMQFMPPKQVLAGLQTGSIDELYKFIFWQAWSILTQDAKAMLFAIQRTGDIADWDWLSGSMNYSLPRMYQALQQLLDLSLVQTQQDAARRYLYSIHRLTSTFLRTEVLGWK